MTNVLVDTSVWVDHFRHRNDALVGLLELDRVLVHPLIVGEMGNEPVVVDARMTFAPLLDRH